MDDREMPTYIDVRITPDDTIGTLIAKLQNYGNNTPIDGVTLDYTTSVITVGPLKK